MKSTITALLLLAGCATTQYKEPARSSYYLSCLQQGIYATTCQCMEKEAIKATDITDVTLANQDQVLNALKEAFPACQEATKKGLDSGSASEGPSEHHQYPRGR